MTGGDCQSQLQTDVDSRGEPYDFGSIMHYPLGSIPAELKAAGETRLTEQSLTEGDIGTGSGLSDLDKAGLVKLYGDNEGNAAPPPPPDRPECITTSPTTSATTTLDPI